MYVTWTPLLPVTTARFFRGVEVGDKIRELPGAGHYLGARRTTGGFHGDFMGFYWDRVGFRRVLMGYSGV